MSFSIQDLPVETQLQIFHYISFVDYFRGLRRVCTLWKDLVDDILTRLHVLNMANAFNANKTLTLMGPKLKYLKELNLSRCVSLNDKAFVHFLSESCQELERVDISKCHLLTDASATALATKHAASLTFLRLDGCTGISTAGLTNLLSKTTSMHSLSLRKLKVQPWSPSMAPALASLEHLTLSACPGVTDVSLQSFAAASTRLIQLRIDECRVSSAAITAVAALLRELRVLTMSFCSAVNDATIAQLVAHCTKLHTVEIESCTLVTDKGVVDLSKLAQLARLNINCCYLVTNKAAEALHLNCRRLAYIDIKGCQSISRDWATKLKETRPGLKVVM